MDLDARFERQELRDLTCRELDPETVEGRRCTCDGDKGRIRSKAWKYDHQHQNDIARNVCDVKGRVKDPIDME